eukprot:gene7243-8919_t
MFGRRKGVEQYRCCVHLERNNRKCEEAGRVTIPNYITIFRFILVPFIVMALLSGSVGAALVGFVIAGVSDGVDGYIARRYDQRSELGAYLDPMADKLLLVTLFVVLGFLNELPVWLVVIVVSRDILIISAVLLSTVMANPVEMRPLFVSKANTALQIVLVAFTLADMTFQFSFGAGRTILRPPLPISWHGHNTWLAMSKTVSKTKTTPPAERDIHVDVQVNTLATAVRRQAFFWTGAVVFLALFLYIFSSILLPFVAGLVLAYFLDPVADRLERLGMSRLLATIVILILFLVTFALLLMILVPILASQMTDFIARLPSYVARLQELIANRDSQWLKDFIGVDASVIRNSLDSLLQQGAGFLSTLLQSIWSSGKTLIDVAALFVVTPVVAFYMLLDWDRMVQSIDNLTPRDHVQTVREIARDMNKAIAGFVRGQGTVCLLLGMIYAVGLTIVGLNFGLLIGLFAGLISFIPYVGSLVGLVLAIGVALVQFWPDYFYVGAVAVVFFIGQFFEGNILQPKLVGSSVGLHPVWLMFALFAFGSLMGFTGMLIAVPTAAAMGVLVRFVIGRYRQSPLYTGDYSKSGRSKEIR